MVDSMVHNSDGYWRMYCWQVWDSVLMLKIKYKKTILIFRESRIHRTHRKFEKTRILSSFLFIVLRTRCYTVKSLDSRLTKYVRGVKLDWFFCYKVFPKITKNTKIQFFGDSKRNYYVTCKILSDDIISVWDVRFAYKQLSIKRQTGGLIYFLIIEKNLFGTFLIVLKTV